MCMFACKGDWNKGLVPNDFFQNLFTHYRDYFEDGQNIKNGRQACYDAFLYFADRILPSINAEVTKYHGEKKCLVRMSNVFSVTDEAYVLLMVENYHERWVSLAQKKNSNDEGGEGVQESRIKRAKYTCSSQGNIHAGWEEKGILRFNEIAGMIKNQRKDKTRNDNLDDALITHWKGMKRDTCRRKPEKVAATRAYRDETEI